MPVDRQVQVGAKQRAGEMKRYYVRRGLLVLLLWCGVVRGAGLCACFESFDSLCWRARVIRLFCLREFRGEKPDPKTGWRLPPCDKNVALAPLVAPYSPPGPCRWLFKTIHSTYAKVQHSTRSTEYCVHLHPKEIPYAESPATTLTNSCAIIELVLFDGCSSSYQRYVSSGLDGVGVQRDESSASQR